jgi:ABC-type amino acid transport substrate-binding protein
LLSLPLLAHAAEQDASDTLKRIRANATLTIGYHESTPPFTFISPDGTVMGYSHDIALKIAGAIQRGAPPLTDCPWQLGRQKKSRIRVPTT